jgi:hypothetical protein
VACFDNQICQKWSGSEIDVHSADAPTEHLDQPVGTADGHSQAAHTSLTELKQVSIPDRKAATVYALKTEI